MINFHAIHCLLQLSYRSIKSDDMQSTSMVYNNLGITDISIVLISVSETNFKRLKGNNCRKGQVIKLKKIIPSSNSSTSKDAL